MTEYVVFLSIVSLATRRRRRYIRPAPPPAVADGASSVWELRGARAVDPSPARGRRWRETPDEGGSWRSARQADQARPHPRPFSREREKGARPSSTGPLDPRAPP